MEPLTVPPVTTRAALRDETVSSGNGIGATNAAQPAEWPCVNCGTSLVVCGEPRCCNDCDHPVAAQPAPALATLLHERCQEDWQRRFDNGARAITMHDVSAHDETARWLASRGVIVAHDLLAAARDHGLCSCGDFGGPRPLGGGREYHYSGCDYDPALRAAIEEADRG